MNATERQWDINLIQTAMRNDGSHWWDRGSMRFFGTRASREVYQGSGGVYFVTSEQPPHGPRGYTVRQFVPESCDIRTVGELCGYKTGRQAKAEAKRLAGDAVEVATATHRPIGELDDFERDMRAECPGITVTTLQQLVRLAKLHHRGCEDWCNTGDMDRMDRARGAIRSLLDGTGLEPIFSGDPRGATVKLKLPSGKTNDWGQEGYCVPTEL